MRIDKYLCDCGIGTRKEVKAILKSGAVCVNGKICKDAAMHIDETTDTVTYGAKTLHYQKYIYLMLNKPSGVVSATFDKRLPTVLDLLPDTYKHFDVFPVGRLDIDTTGLLILTNDGQLAHRMISPKHHVAKTYFADIEGTVTQSDADAFAEGVTLDDGYVCLPGNLHILKSDDESQIELTIYEGKFHQVKRMFEAVGKRVTSLKRLSMGGITLDKNLPEGQIRPLTEQEIELLQKIQ